MSQQPRKRQALDAHLLTDPYIKALQPRTAPFLDWDTKQDKLAVRVQPSGHKSFKFIYSRHGRPRWFSIGDDNIGVVKARKEAAKLLVLVNDGKDPAADKKAKRSAGTFEELATSYVEQYAKKENKSWAQADSLVKKHLIPKWGKLKAADIIRSDVKTRIKGIEAPIVANQTLAAASAIFSWAIREEEGGVKINPCSDVKRNDTNSRDRVLSDSEIPKFWTAFENDVDLIEGLALKMILLTGQRPGEVSCMRTEHIEDGWWTLPKDPIPALGWPGTKNKNKTAKQKKRPAHKVWLPKIAQQIIAEIGSTGMVFASPRGNAIDGLDADMRTICEKLGVNDPAKPHDLRRTHGTAITGLGFGRDAMNRIENHVDGGIADVYDQSKYADENKKIMEAVADKFMALINGSADKKAE
ncbi:tyrosine-type recombinase/integrase [Bradyrhizobium erythrophlei]|uniref:Phage integrase family protein n=1 Tax=Bradyrhizobium erythrophlei TaxID=1437360 RepID=A0A1M5IA27_9BRAD|nr:integrase family protein [Bradyrhizobium erythrophlei]SHG24740.1 Phage integrase family protein [Bradyrhizobium erythrophlei]